MKIPHAAAKTAATAAAKSLQSRPTLCDPRDGSPPGSPIPGILQTRTSKWVAISFSNAWKWKVKVKLFSHVRFFEAPWTVAYQPPPSVGFSSHEYWNELPFPLALTLSSPTYAVLKFLGVTVTCTFLKKEFIIPLYFPVVKRGNLQFLTLRFLRWDLNFIHMFLAPLCSCC